MAWLIIGCPILKSFSFSPGLSKSDYLCLPSLTDDTFVVLLGSKMAVSENDPVDQLR